MITFIKQTVFLLSILTFASSANAVGKIYLDQLGMNADSITIKLNMFRTGGAVTLTGCDEGCPTGLAVNKKTRFTRNGMKIKRKDIKNLANGNSGYIKFFKKTKTVILIDWK